MNKLNSLLCVNLHFLLDVLLSLSCVLRSDHWLLLTSLLWWVYMWLCDLHIFSGASLTHALPNRIYYEFMALKTMDSRRLRLWTQLIIKDDANVIKSFHFLWSYVSVIYMILTLPLTRMADCMWRHRDFNRIVHNFVLNPLQTVV